MDTSKSQFDTSFAAHWDTLIDWERRRQADSGFLASLLRRHGARKVLDVATGTGFDSVQLMLDGFEVTSLDGSLEMLEMARTNAAAHGVRLHAVHSTWGDCSCAERDFDAIICLGNSYACTTSEHERRAAAREWHALLRPGGVVVIDHRNYDAMLEGLPVPLAKLYYLGQTVQIVPEQMSESMTRFTYVFPDGQRFHLNMVPLKRAQLIDELCGERLELVETYGDNAATFNSREVGFFQHVFKKPPITP